MKGIKHISTIEGSGTELTRNDWESEVIHTVANGTSFPESPSEMDLFYRTDLHVLYIYDGTEWTQVGGVPSGTIAMWHGLIENIPYGWSLCLTGDSLIKLADGTLRRIDEIVENKEPVDVASFDDNTGQVVVSRVINWYKNEATRDSWLRLKVAKGKGNGSRSLTLTYDHPVWTDRGWITARDLTLSDKVYRYDDALSNTAKQAILGMWLGDGSMDERGVFSITHGDSQRDYLLHCAEILNNANTQTAIAGNGYGKGFLNHHTRVALKTICSDVVGLCLAARKRGRKVTPDILANLGATGLAYWYMDDGNLQKDNRCPNFTRAQLHTEGFNESEVMDIIEWFKLAHGITATPYKRSNTNGHILRFDADGTDKFLALVAPYIHPSMRYKLTDDLKGIPYLLDGRKWTTRKLVPFDIWSIKPISSLSPSKRNGNIFKVRYDIEVEQTHSFIANGFLVHNCDGTSGTPDLREKFVRGAPDETEAGGTGGEATHTLTIDEMPSHTHTFSGKGSSAGSSYGSGTYVWATKNTSSVGGGAAHNNLPPYYNILFIMKL